jgi:hypothetical protein
MNLRLTYLAILLFLAGQVSAQETQPNATGLVFSDPSIYETIPKFAVDGLVPVRPASYQLSPIPTPGSQGSQSSCVGWAVAYGAKSMSNAIKSDISRLDGSLLFSPAFLFNNTKISDCQSGTFIPRGLSFYLRWAHFPWTL